MVIEEEAIEALYSAIDRLPAQSARIMRLVVKGDKNQEIADQLGISVNSVKTLKYNALNILRKELTGSLLLLLAWFEVQPFFFKKNYFSFIFFISCVFYIQI